MTFNDPKHYATSRATNILPLIICILFILTIFFIVLWSYLLCIYHHQSRIQHQKNFPPHLWYNWLIPSGFFSKHCLIDFFFCIYLMYSFIFVYFLQGFLSVLLSILFYFLLFFFGHIAISIFTMHSFSCFLPQTIPCINHESFLNTLCFIHNTFF